MLALFLRMFIVHVTPLTKSALHRLSYFSATSFPIGSIVMVPLRNKEVPALVIEHEDARAIKSVLRTNIYETKKLKNQEPQIVLAPEFVKAAATTARHFATATGSIVNAYTPANILKSALDGTIKAPTTAPDERPGFQKLVLQLPRLERIEKYKTLIRSAFAQKHSVLLVVPTTRDAHFFKEAYSRGIDQYTFVLDSSQTKKQQCETWNAILNEVHPVLIIATPTFASIPRRDVGTIILEHEISSAYKQQTRPKADARVLIEHLAHEMGIPLVLAGTTLSLRTQRELRDGSAHELEEHARKLRIDTDVRIVDLKETRAHEKEHKQEFPALSNEALSLIRATHESGSKSFVFAARRGIASQTVCNDCNSTVVCHTCGAPVVLHERGTSRELLCHRCGHSRDAHETCTTCTSWNLTPLGIGIERIDNYLRLHCRDIPLFVLSSDTAPTRKDAEAIIAEYEAVDGGILVGTEMALSYLARPVGCSVMSSVDSLMCIPDFRIEEKIFGILATLRECTDHTLLVETVNTHNSMLKHAQSGAVDAYATDELELRNRLSYPPYTRIIKVSCAGPRATIIRDMQKFVDYVHEYSPRVFAGFIPKNRGSELHALIRVPSHQWPDKKLADILESLPPSFSVDIDPERVL